MEISLKGKVAIVTGGGQGIGRILAQMLAKDGVNVAIADINIDSANTVAKEVESFDGDVIPVKTDVSKLEETENLVGNAVDKFGKVDILVHNAAIFSVKPFMNTPPEMWEKIIGISQIGALNCSKSVLPHMIEQKNGRIISRSISGCWRFYLLCCW